MKSFIKDVVIAVAIAVLILQFIKPTIVKQNSMEPTLWTNNYIILSKQAYTFSEPNRGDIVVFHTDLTTPEGAEKLLIKRVIGLPGDIVNIKDGKVIINGVTLDEPYILGPDTSGDIQDLKVPPGQVFVMGDNRDVSLDSRSPDVGCVNIKAIVGKAVLRLYPFNEITTFHYSSDVCISRMT